jgi:hypothetical protein
MMIRIELPPLVKYTPITIVRCLTVYHLSAQVPNYSYAIVKERSKVMLEKEQADLIARLEAQTLTGEQIQSLKDFAAKVAGGLEHADEDFETRRQIIDTLDVQANAGGGGRRKGGLCALYDGG